MKIYNSKGNLDHLASCKRADPFLSPMRRRKQSNASSVSEHNSSVKGSVKGGAKSSSNGKPLPLLIGTCISLGILYFLAFVRDSSENRISNADDDVSRLRSKQPANVETNNSIYPKDTLLTSPTTQRPLHLVFSTDCSPYMHWQSYLFFFSALRINQPGIITRIASGCDEEQLEIAREWHMTHVQNVMSDRFRIHFTPDYSGEKDYKFFNKPFGFRHFLENSEFMVNNDGDLVRSDDIVILCDPDFLLLRPLTDDFSRENETVMHEIRRNILDHRSKGKRIVDHGNPFAQTWDGLGSTWMTYNLDEIAGSTSPAKGIDEGDTRMFFMVGPPYIGTIKDMRMIAEKWTEFSPKLLKENPLHHTEMCKFTAIAVISNARLSLTIEYPL